MTEMTATELRLERTYDAPRERVYEAWTNPAPLRGRRLTSSSSSLTRAQG
ncbi:MAG TPA: hypothetical protein VES79_09215 [Solirubrobacteraceae bacterium]|nr:hypothetical protein [Solirubrobacteraceae bacterium]